MFYIVGLGNPGEQYQDTPHNIGWMILDLLQKKHNIDFDDFSFDRMRKADISQGVIGECGVTLIKPQTFMNESGKSLKDINDIDIDKVIVVYDDIDLPFGVVKIARNRGSGGHNGIKSIEEVLNGRNFIRIRIGVCPTDWFGNPRKPKGNNAVQNYLVKRKMSRKYTGQLADIADRSDTYIQRIIAEGYTSAVSKQK